MLSDYVPFTTVQITNNMKSTVVVHLVLAVIMVGFELSYARARCPRRQWKRVTKSMVDMVHSYNIGVRINYITTGGGLQINAKVYNNGCGATGSGSVTYIKGRWTQIRYTQEFRGSASCWKIFGGAAHSKYSKTFAFYPKLAHKPANSVHDLSTSAGDGIFNELRMNSRSRNQFDGRVYRCDNHADNFWHVNNGSGLRRATVILRRANMNARAGIMTDTSCGKPSYVIKDIWVLV